MWALLKTAGLAFAVANLKRRIRALAVKGILAGAAAVIAIVAICFLLVALHIWLSGLLNPVASAAIIGVVLLVIAGALLFLASRPNAANASPIPVAPAAAGGEPGWAKLAQSFTGGEQPLASPVFQAAALALIAGFFLGRRRPDRDRDEDAD